MHPDTLDVRCCYCWSTLHFAIKSGRLPQIAGYVGAQRANLVRCKRSKLIDWCKFWLTFIHIELYRKLLRNSLKIVQHESKNFTSINKQIKMQVETMWLQPLLVLTRCLSQIISLFYILAFQNKFTYHLYGYHAYERFLQLLNITADCLVPQTW